MSDRFSSIKEFDIIREVGKGGYSIVYLARHKVTKREYAIKCAMKYKTYHKEKSSGSQDEVTKDISDKTRQEIKTLQVLRHKRIIRIRGWFEDSDNIYIVLPYMEGGDLSGFLKREGIPSKELTIKFMTQIISAVKYCHKKGILHRDIKLNNILIDKNMDIKLTDFGLCAIKDENNDYFYDRVGTARYTAPELLHKDGHDEGADVWGIGIILFLLLTGKYPFDGSKKHSIFNRIKEKRINYDNYNLDEEEIHLLKRLLCKNPRYRIQLDDILETDWFVNNSS